MQHHYNQQLDNNQNNESHLISVLEYLELFVKYKRMIFITTSLFFVISVIVAFTLPNWYESTSLITPPQQDNGLTGLMTGQMGGNVASLASDLLGKATPSELYASMLQSQAIKDKIIDRFKLLDVYNIRHRSDAYKMLDKTVKIEVGSKDGIISITVEDKDPKRAADMANEFVKYLNDLIVGLNITSASQNRVFIEDRLAKAKNGLSSAEESLKNFQLKNKALDISEQAKGTIQGVADIMAQLAIEEVKLSTLRRLFTDNSQEVKSQNEIVKNLKRQKSKLEGSSLGNSIPSIGSVPALGEEYTRLLRTFKIQEMLVEMLTKQYEMTKYNEANSVSTLQIIQTARIADKKSSPKRSLIIVITTMFAMIFSLLTSFILEFKNNMPQVESERWRNVLKSIISSTSRGNSSELSRHN